MSERIPMVPGTRYGKWTVLEDGYHSGKQKQRACLCQCDCGTVRIVNSIALRRGATKSCGCAIKTALGVSHDRIYKIYRHIKDRCYNKNHIHYRDYGGRGIGMCQEWQDSFLAFYGWSMENGYADNLSIDRIDNSKGYFPENCRWTDGETQQNNRRFNVNLTYDGKTQSMSRWSRELEIPTSTLFSRYYNGWTAEDVLTRPVDKSKSSKKKGA